MLGIKCFGCPLHITTATVKQQVISLKKIEKTIDFMMSLNVLRWVRENIKQKVWMLKYYISCWNTVLLLYCTTFFYYEKFWPLLRRLVLWIQWKCTHATHLEYVKINTFNVHELLMSCSFGIGHISQHLYKSEAHIFLFASSISFK